MPLDTFVIIAEQYDTEDDALADYDAVQRLYQDLGIIDTYDAAVVTRRPNGKVDIVRRTEIPTRTGARRGLATGLAIGVIAALFPGVALAGAAATGALAGTGIGALAGHASGGISRGELKDLGELLDDGTSGLVVVAASDVESKVRGVIKRAKRHAKALIRSDAKKLEEVVDAL